MLDDYNVINDINPFVVKDFSLPGTWSDPYKFAPDKEVVEEKAQWEVPYKSPACSMVALGDKTVSLCDKPQDTISCPMSRPLEPRQNFEAGMWTLYPKKETVKKSEINLFVNLFVLALALIFLSFALR